MKKFTDFLKDQLADPEVKKEFQALEPFYNLAKDVVTLRKRKGLTQKELAEKIDSTQAVVSRIENGAANCTIETIQKIGDALDAVLEIHLESRTTHEFLQEIVFEQGLIKEPRVDSLMIQKCEDSSQVFTWVRDQEAALVK